MGPNRLRDWELGGPLSQTCPHCLFQSLLTAVQPEAQVPGFMVCCLQGMSAVLW